MNKNKEFLYVGYYFDTLNRLILKIGTTNDLKRRQQEHTRNYRRATHYTLPKESSFIYLWSIQLSKYNTIRFEDLNKELWRQAGIGEFIRNDRFLVADCPQSVQIKIRKTYSISLRECLPVADTPNGFEPLLRGRTGEVF